MKGRQGNTLAADAAVKLRDCINAKRWKPGERLPTVRDMCKELDISGNTLSVTLSILETEGLIVRRQRSGVFVYQPEEMKSCAPVLVVSPIADFAPGSEDHWSKHVILGCFSALAQNGLACKPLNFAGVQSSGGNSWPELSKLLEKESHDCSGIILTWSACGEKELEKFIANKGIPVVKIGRSSHLCRHNFVSIDHFEAGRMAGEAALGCLPGPFLFLSGGSAHDFPRRMLINGFIDRLQEARSGDFQLDILPVEGTSIEEGRNWMRAFLKKNSPPRCVFCVGDMLAIGAMEACQELGFRVPEQIGVIGSAGLDADYSCRPALTHVRQPMEQLGSTAVDMLKEMYFRGRMWQLGSYLSVSWVDGGSLKL